MNMLPALQKACKDKRTIWLMAVVFLLICSFTSRHFLKQFEETSSKTLSFADSTHHLQAYLNEQYKIIAEYNQALFSRQTTDDTIIELKKKEKGINDSLQKVWTDFVDYAHTKAAKATKEQVKATLNNYFQQLGKLEDQQKETAQQLVLNSNNIMQLDGQINSGKARYADVVKQLTELTKHLHGAGEITANKISYRYFIVTKGLHQVQVHNPKAGPTSIEDIKQQLQKAKSEPLMITNGGMFAPGFKPQGLLIEGSKKCSNLDTLKPDKNTAKNFHLLPNGVFYIDTNGSGQVIETDSFRHVYPAKLQPAYATQSGPMLVTNNQINRNFKAGSTHVNIRSGVGKIDENRMIFVISDVPVNFFDFTLVFKDLFGCKNALYLDGAISQMYIPEKLLKNQKPVNGEFGPIVSVTAKKK